MRYVDVTGLSSFNGSWDGQKLHFVVPVLNIMAEKYDPYELAENLPKELRRAQKESQELNSLLELLPYLSCEPPVIFGGTEPHLTCTATNAREMADVIINWQAEKLRIGLHKNWDQARQNRAAEQAMAQVWTAKPLPFAGRVHEPQLEVPNYLAQVAEEMQNTSSGDIDFSKWSSAEHPLLKLHELYNTHSEFLDPTLRDLELQLQITIMRKNDPIVAEQLIKLLSNYPLLVDAPELFWEAIKNGPGSWQWTWMETSLRSEQDYIQFRSALYGNMEYMDKYNIHDNAGYVQTLFPARRFGQVKGMLPSEAITALGPLLSINEKTDAEVQEFVSCALVVFENDTDWYKQALDNEHNHLLETTNYNHERVEDYMHDLSLMYPYTNHAYAAKAFELINDNREHINYAAEYWNIPNYAIAACMADEFSRKAWNSDDVIHRRAAHGIYELYESAALMSGIPIAEIMENKDMRDGKTSILDRFHGSNLDVGSAHIRIRTAYGHFENYVLRCTLAIQLTIYYINTSHPIHQLMNYGVYLFPMYYSQIKAPLILLLRSWLKDVHIYNHLQWVQT